MPKAVSTKGTFTMMDQGAGVHEVQIYGPLGYWDIEATDVINQIKALEGVKKLVIRLNCPGGDVWEGNAIYSYLMSYPAPVEIMLDGFAASMGSILLCAGYSKAPRNALVMIHNPSGGIWGEAKDLRKRADVLDQIKEVMLTVYQAKGGTDTDWSEVMDDETWWTAEKAHEMGLIDELLEPVEMTGFSPEQMTAACIPDSIQAQFKPNPNPAGHPPANLSSNEPGEKAAMPDPVKKPATNPASASNTSEAVTMAQFQQQDQSRRADIAAAFGVHGERFSALLTECQNDYNMTVDGARQKLLDAMGSESTPNATAPQAGVRTTFDDSGVKKANEAMENAILFRAGLKKRQDVEKDNPYLAHSLAEMARAHLEGRNVAANSFGDGRMGMVATAFAHTSSDFSQLLSNVANKAVMVGYNESPEVFDQFTRQGTLSDFKIASRVDMDAAPSLRQVREGAEYKYITLGDSGELLKLATYGEIFSITRQAIINDDLDVFSRIPRLFGSAARRTIGDLVMDIFLSNPKMSDNTALFHANHKNVVTGAFDANKVEAMRVAMATQKLPGREKDKGAVTNATPAFLLTSVANGGLARQMMSSQSQLGQDNPNVGNPVFELATPIQDARLDGQNASFLLADPNMYDTIEVSYLDGNPDPRVEQQSGWAIDGVDFKVSIDAAVKALSYRNMTQNTGE